jgi:hypothetical protein
MKQAHLTTFIALGLLAMKCFIFWGFCILLLASCAPRTQAKDPLNNPQYALTPQTIDTRVLDLPVRYLLQEEVLERQRAKGFDYAYENGHCTIALDIGYEGLRQAAVLSVGYCLYHQSYSNPDFEIANKAALAWVNSYYESCGYVLAPLGLPVNDGTCQTIPTLKQAIAMQGIYIPE